MGLLGSVSTDLLVIRDVLFHVEQLRTWMLPCLDGVSLAGVHLGSPGSSLANEEDGVMIYSIFLRITSRLPIDSTSVYVAS
jgi:hypothetical protein